MIFLFFLKFMRHLLRLVRLSACFCSLFKSRIGRRWPLGPIDQRIRIIGASLFDQWLILRCLLLIYANWIDCTIVQFHLMWLIVTDKDGSFSKGGFLDFFLFLCKLFNTASLAAPQIPFWPEDAGIKPRTVATLAMTARRSIYSARSRHRRIIEINRCTFRQPRPYLVLDLSKATSISWHCLFDKKKPVLLWEALLFSSNWGLKGEAWEFFCTACS